MSTATPPLPRTAIFTGIVVEESFPVLALPSFIDQGLTQIALLGTSSSQLEQVKANILQAYPQLELNINTYEVDIKSSESVGVAAHKVRAELGAWDAFIHCPSPLPTSRTTVRGADEDEWWACFERNVRGLHHIARHFFTKMKAGATFLNLMTANPTSSTNSRGSAEVASQIAGAKVVEYLARENEDSGLIAINVVLAVDDVEGHRYPMDKFWPWALSEKARFMSGRVIATNDDIDAYLEMEERTKSVSTMLK